MTKHGHNDQIFKNMKDPCLKYLRDIQLMKNYFAMLESHGGEAPLKEIQEMAGESVFISGERARKLITELVKNKNFMECLKNEIEG